MEQNSTTPILPLSTDLADNTDDPLDPSAHPDFDLEAFLQDQNREFLQSLAPTLAYTLTLMLCGLAGNSLVLAVYHRRFKPSVTRTYILAMSVSDLLTNVLSLPADMVEVALHNTFSDRWLCKGFRTVKSFLGFLTAFILVAVALDRQRAICRPQDSPTTVKHTVHVLLVVSGLSLAFTLPYSVLTGPKTVPYPHTNVTGLECSVDDMYTKSLFLFVYNMISGLLLVICIALMLGSYVRIARQLYLHRKNTAVIMSGSSAGASKDRKESSTSPPHTYTFEESSSHSTIPTPSLTAHRGKISPAEDEIELAGADTLDQSGTRRATVTIDTSTAETDIGDAAKNLNGAAPSGTGDLVDSAVPPGIETGEVDFTMADPQKSTMMGMDNNAADCGNDPVRTNNSNPHDASTRHNNADDGTGGAAAPRKGSIYEQTSSRARAVIGSIRRAASNARSYVRRASRSSPSPKRRGSVKKIPTRTTLMMFVLTVVFIVNFLPYLLLVSLRSRLGMDLLVQRLGLNGYHIGLRSYFINSAVNPLVYSFCSARFRQECQRFFHCRGK